MEWTTIRQVVSSKRIEEKIPLRNKWLAHMTIVAVVGMSLTGVGAGSVTTAAPIKPSTTAILSSPAVKLQGDLRKLWIDHTVWTRSYIVSALGGLEDQKDVLARLLRNQQDIGNTIKPYYGEEAGNKLAALLRDHILIAGQLIEAAKSRNQADYQKYDKAWHQNADDIAKLLSGANPNWSYRS